MHALRASSCAVLILLSGACRSPAPDERPLATPAYDAETFFETITIFGASWSADAGRLLVSSDESGVFNAYALELATGEHEQLTFSDQNATFAVSWFPHDDRFLYTADQGGDELNHLFVQEPGGGSVDLTPGQNVKASFLRWSADEASFFVRTNERDSRYFDLYRYDAEPDPATGRYPRERIFENPGGFDLSDVSRDGRWVALTKVRNNADSNVWLAALEPPGAEPILVTAHEGDVSYGVADFSPDGSTLYITSNEGSEFTRVWSYDLSTQARAVAFAADWDVSSYGFSRDGRHLVVSTNEDASTVIRVYDARTGAELPLPQVPAGDLVGPSFEPGGERLAFYVNGDRSPSNLYLADLGTGGLERLTDTLAADIDPEDLVEAEVVRYPSFDGLEIPALLYRPHRATAAAPAPALVWVHGGPGGQSRRGYNPVLQHLVNHGYAVLAVNNRGSSGYGKTFFHFDDRKHGDVDLQDCVFGRHYLEGLDWVDGSRVGIFGGSYGGYMVCAALAFEPDAFEVGIDLFGVTNWIRTLESIPPWWADFREALYAEMGDPSADRDRLEARSPLLHANRIRKPLLVVQGANDPRVLQAESDELVAAVRASGVPVEYVLFPDEGHGFRNKANRIAVSNAYLRFLDGYLRGPRP